MGREGRSGEAGEGAEEWGVRGGIGSEGRNWE